MIIGHCVSFRNDNYWTEIQNIKQQLIKLDFYIKNSRKREVLLLETSFIIPSCELRGVHLENTHVCDGKWVNKCYFVATKLVEKTLNYRFSRPVRLSGRERENMCLLPHKRMR